jgi:hypothetical protein
VDPGALQHRAGLLLLPLLLLLRRRLLLLLLAEQGGLALLLLDHLSRLSWHHKCCTQAQQTAGGACDTFEQLASTQCAQ